MKKSSLFSFGALLALSVFLFTACPQEGEEAKTFTVTFDAGGGTVNPATITVEEGATIASLPTPTKADGSTFGGWFTDLADAATQFTTATKVTGNITVHAKWTPVSQQPGTPGDVDVDEETAGVDPVAAVTGVEAVYTITIGTALVSGETLTVANVANAAVTYPFGNEVSKEDQAAAIAELINEATGALYEAEVGASSNAAHIITLTALTPGVKATSPTAKIITTTNLTVANPTQGVNEVAEVTGVEAVYTITITSPLVTGETLTIANVADNAVTYAYNASATTKEAQAAAIAELIEDATGALYDAAVGVGTDDHVITLTAKAVGEKTQPDATVAVPPAS